MTTCAACGTPGATGLHLVQRRFTDWSGTWTNAVVCDGREVAGEPVSTKPTNKQLTYESRTERQRRARRAATAWAWKGFGRRSYLDAAARCDALALRAQTPKARARLSALARYITDNQ